IPALKQKGFEHSPFSSAWFGRNNLIDSTYKLCRISKNSELEMLTTHITREDSWIQIFLNIFKLEPTINALTELKERDGIQFGLPPNNMTEMRLRMDDYKGPPLFHGVRHKLKSFYTEKGFEESVQNLGELIKKDMENIDHFIKRWHELHKPTVTDWEGNKISS
ncbi:hypothetical protein, partial [Pedobacter sp. ASV12]|uniref:hypothetical protein n=1 Tax=Pedobacter sp. ASV12 TaxID=2795120 RepID=UPI0018EA7ED3